MLLTVDYIHFLAKTITFRLMTDYIQGFALIYCRFYAIINSETRGIGFIEVVVTENNIEDMGQMITFKKDEKYYTCFMNGQDNELNSNKASREFSSYNYIDGFNIVKNLEQEKYKFTVHYDGSKVIGFECAPFVSSPFELNVDDVTFIEDFFLFFIQHKPLPLMC